MTPDPLAALQDRTLGVLHDLLPSGTTAALVDFPSHQNAGDSLIYLGQAAYLRRLGVQVGYLADIWRYDAAELRRRVPEGPVLLQGGGNLGDRWEETQAFREQVIADFPDRPVVQMPQSVEFRDSMRAAAAARVFAHHSRLTVLVRETPSFQAAQRLFGAATTVTYCPDAALGVGRLPRSYPAHVDVLALRRRDSESTGSPFILPGATVEEVDWGLSGPSRAAWWGVKVPGAVARHVPATRRPLYPALVAGYRAQASLNVAAARRTLAAGRVVLTDRLHATVLAALSGIPVVAMDNATGKVSAVVRDYLGTLPGVRFAADATEAAEQISALLG